MSTFFSHRDTRVFNKKPSSRPSSTKSFLIFGHILVLTVSQKLLDLGPVHMGADSFGSVPKLERIGLAYTRDHIYLIQFGSAISTRLDRIE